MALEALGCWIFLVGYWVFSPFFPGSSPLPPLGPQVILILKSAVQLLFLGLTHSSLPAIGPAHFDFVDLLRIAEAKVCSVSVQCRSYLQVTVTYSDHLRSLL